MVGWSRGGIDGGGTGVSEVVQGVGEGGEHVRSIHRRAPELELGVGPAVRVQEVEDEAVRFLGNGEVASELLVSPGVGDRVEFWVEGGEVGRVESEDVRVGSVPAAQFGNQESIACHRRRC